MKVFLTLMFFTVIIGPCVAQNLVTNPSFEDTVGCPNSYAQLDSTSGWFTPNLSSPDYYHTCSSVLCNPLNSFTGYQSPHDGEAYAGLIIWKNSGDREYLEIELTGPLKQNKCYHFEMFVNGANKAKFTTDDIQVYFSDTAVMSMPYFAVLPFAPQIVNQIGNVLDTLLWTSVNGDYVAHGGESYLIVGNFMDNASTDTFSTYSPGAIWDFAYSYVDDISLTEIQVAEINLGVDTTFCQGATLQLNATSFESYLWQDGSSAQTFLFSDTVLGYYNLNVIATDSNGCIATDTINISVEDCTDYIEFIDEEASLHINPNPNNGVFKLELLQLKSTVSVTDITGRLIFHLEIKERNAVIDLSDQPPGIYIVSVKNENFVTSAKVAVLR